MASFVWREKLEALNKRRREWAVESAKAEDLIYFHPIAKYDEKNDDPNRSFYDYLLPNEIFVLRTMNLESFERTEPHCKVFKAPGDLNTVLHERDSSTSNNEDGPPASEELFFDDDQMETFNRFRNKGAECKPLTYLQRRLLNTLSRITIEPKDTVAAKTNKIQRRLHQVRLYCKEMKQKRYARSYKRFKKIRARNHDLSAEASALESKEIEDKNLGRKFYYGPGEPKELTALLEVRRRAIKKKFEIYQTDEEYRKVHIDRVFFNVFRDVPESEKNHDAFLSEISQISTDGKAVNFNNTINSSIDICNQPDSKIELYTDSVFDTMNKEIQSNINQITNTTGKRTNRDNLNDKLDKTMASLREYYDASIQNSIVNNKTKSNGALPNALNESNPRNANHNDTTKSSSRKKSSKNARHKKDKTINKETVYMESRNTWTPQSTAGHPKTNAETSPIYLEQRRKRVQRSTGPKEKSSTKTPTVEKHFSNYIENDANEQFEDPKWDDNFDKKMFEIFRNESFEHYQNESGYAIASRLFEMQYAPQ